MEGDARGRRVAVISDRLVNPQDGALDGLAVLEAEGWGVIQLPPSRYPAAVRTSLLEHVAEAVEEFLKHGYTVVAVGLDARAKRALAAAGIPPLPAVNPRTTAALHAFLRETATSEPS
jgi:hypothetical protein